MQFVCPSEYPEATCLLLNAGTDPNIQKESNWRATHSPSCAAAAVHNAENKNVHEHQKSL